MGCGPDLSSPPACRGLRPTFPYPYPRGRPMFRHLLACVLSVGLVTGGAAPVFASTPEAVVVKGEKGKGKKGNKKGKKGAKKGKGKKKGGKKGSPKKGGAKKGKGAAK